MDISEVKCLVDSIMAKNNGIVKKEEFKNLGIDYRRINQLVSQGQLIRLKKGYYTNRVENLSESTFVALLFQDSNLCMESALYAYGYIKERPYGWYLAVDRNTSKSRFNMDYPKIIPVYTDENILQLGRTKICFEGNYFGIYDKDRLICDCIKYENKLERSVYHSAISSYLLDSDKNIDNLLLYAKKRRVQSKVNSLIKVWL